MSIYSLPTSPYTPGKLIPRLNVPKQDTPKPSEGQGVSYVDIKNYVLRSDDFTNAAWTKTGVTVAPLSDSDDPLTSSYTELNFSSATGSVVQTRAGLTAFNKATISLFIKAPTTKSLTLRLTIGATIVNTAITTQTGWQFITAEANVVSQTGFTYSLITTQTGIVHVYGPQIIIGNTVPRMYIASVATEGIYKFPVYTKRFIMVEDTTLLYATPAMETPDATTAKMME